MKFLLNVFILIAISFFLLVKDLHAEKKPIDLNAINNWQAINFEKVSNDANWFLYKIDPTKPEEEINAESGGSDDLPPEPKDGAEENLQEGSENSSSEDTPKDNSMPEGSSNGFAMQEPEEPYKLVVKSIQGKKEYEFSSAKSIWKTNFSENSNWFGFLREAVSETPGSMPSDPMGGAGMGEMSGMPGGADESPKTELVLLNLKTGKEKVLDDVAQYDFANNWVILQKKSGNASYLLLYHLTENRYEHLGLTSEHALNQSGRYLAWLISQPDHYGNGVYLRDNKTNKVTRLDEDEAGYKSLFWAKEGDALVLVKSRKQPQDKAGKNEGVEDKMQHQILAVSGIGKGKPKVIFIGPGVKGFPENMELAIEGDGPQGMSFMGGSDSSAASWLEDRSGLTFNIRKIKEKESDDDMAEGGMPSTDPMGPMPGAPGEADPKVPNVAIWHWKQDSIPSQTQVGDDGGKLEQEYPAIYWLKKKKLVQLLNEDDAETIYIQSVNKVKRNHQYVMAIDTGDYLEDIINGTAASNQRKDIYLIDLNSGKKRKVLEQVLNLNESLSPDGKSIVYFNEGDFHLYTVKNGKQTNLTKNLSVSFVGNDDANIERLSVKGSTWTKDGHLLLEGNWDIWYVPIRGGKPNKPVNLTVNGAKDKVDYSILPLYEAGSDEPLEINLSKSPLFVYALEKRTRRTGIGQVRSGKPGIKWLRSLDNVSYSGVGRSFYGPAPFIVSKDRKSYFYSRSTYKNRVYYTVGKDFKKPRQLLVDDINSFPERSEYLWSSGAQIVNYRCKWGDELEGALFLPANYKKGQRYPMVTIIYETDMSPSLHQYTPPNLHSYDWTALTSRGYAVFMADVRFQFQNPGLSGFDCLMPGIDAAIKTGIVDPDRLGLHGHSWGGYQSAFYITQTDRFKGVIAGAALTDLISMYGSVYWNSMIPSHMLLERGQGRMVKNIWEDWSAYQKNSPLYYAPKVKTPLLLLHNDKDGAVDFTQGVSFFNALRRLKKEVAMLQYRGENHGVQGRANNIDYRQRQLEFWEHYLKGKPAPAWWTEGIKQKDMNDHLEERGIKDIVPPSQAPEDESEETKN